MGEREDNVYKAKLAEQAERYDGKNYWKNAWNTRVSQIYIRLCNLTFFHSILFFKLSACNSKISYDCQDSCKRNIEYRSHFDNYANFLIFWMMWKSLQLVCCLALFMQDLRIELFLLSAFPCSIGLCKTNLTEFRLSNAVLLRLLLLCKTLGLSVLVSLKLAFCTSKENFFLV